MQPPQQTYMSTSPPRSLPYAGLGSIPPLASSDQPSNPLPYAGLGSISQLVTSDRPSSSPSIKSFLAVNKSVVHNKSSTSVGGTHFDNSTQQAQAINSRLSNYLDSNRSSPGNFLSSLQSPSPPPSFTTPHLLESPNVTDLSSPNLTDTESDFPTLNLQAKMASRKRKTEANGSALTTKKPKVVDPSKKTTKKGAKSKEPKPEQAKEKLPQAIFMRILEFTPPSFLSKARLISKSFKGMVDEFDSIFVNCRRENYGWDMPSPPKGLTERQYSDLFGGKGCLEPGCTDTMSSRTHWSWAKRWCQPCWVSKIVREDRALKQYQATYNRITLTKLFECIPAGIHDSFLKPHDYNDNTETRNRQAPRLYKYFLIADIPKIIHDYESLTPPAFVEDPSHTADQIAAARAAHQTLMGELDEKRNQFFVTRKKENDEHMAKVQKIETAIKEKREENRKPNNEHRDARKLLFSNCATRDLPHIPLEFVQSTQAYKAATRIFRNSGTERGWQTLKPKIEKEWEDESRKKQAGPPPPSLDGTVETTEPVINREPVAQEPSLMRQRPMGYSPHGMFGGNPSISDLGSSLKNRNNSMTSRPHPTGMFPDHAYRGQTHMPYLNGNFVSPSGYNGPASNVYQNHPNQFHQMMGSHNTQYRLPNNAYNTPSLYPPYSSQHGSYQANRDMSISSVLSDPLHFDPSRSQRQP